MGGTIRARVIKGTLKPLEKLNVPDGSEVTVTILETPPRRDPKSFDEAAGSWKGTVDAKKLIRNIYRSRLVSTRRQPKL